MENMNQDFNINNDDDNKEKKNKKKKPQILHRNRLKSLLKQKLRAVWTYQILRQRQ